MKLHPDNIPLPLPVLPFPHDDRPFLRFAHHILNLLLLFLLLLAPLDLAGVVYSPIDDLLSRRFFLVCFVIKPCWNEGK